MPEDNKPSLETLAVQMKYVTETLGEIKALLTSHGQQMSRIPVIEVQLGNHTEQIDRAFSSIKSVRMVTDENSAAITHSKGMFKVATAVMSVMTGISVTVAGWTYNQLDSLKATDRDYLLRISAIEIRNTEAEKRTSNEAERINQRGWVRK